ncbi:MAG: hypothetical protein N3D77_06035 [Geminicoccaceae bacterium]|nr:hypothetical protein [Geminicoccaceae bacterium]
MNLSAWDVIWPYDPGVEPPKPKLWVCVEPEQLWFLRINSNPAPGSIALPEALHPFLARDSWLHCYGELIETDEHELATLLGRQRIPERSGVVGQIATAVRAAALAAIRRSPQLAPATIRRIEAALRDP